MRTDLVGYVPGTIRSAVRRAANRFDVDIVRDPFPRRLAKLCALLDVRTLVDVDANAGQYATMVRGAGYEGLEQWALEPGFCDPRTGRMLQCDGIFGRPAAVAVR